MIFIIVPAVSIISILLGKKLLGKWFNHLSIYTTVWTILILLYELRLLPYVKIAPYTWIVVLSAFCSFFFGVVTIVFAKKLFFEETIIFKKSDISLNIFADNGKIVKYSILILSVISILSATQHWIVLINMFGSIPAVLLNATTIYRLQVQREIKEFIPYLPILGYVAIFLSGIYTAYKGKFSVLTFLPFIGIILKEIATLGRAGMLLALMEFVFSFFYFRFLLKRDKSERFIFSKTSAIVASTLLIVLLIFSSTLVKISRISSENYRGASRELKQLNENMIISPSIYLYFSADLGVLNQYLKGDGEKTIFGQNTFLPIFDFLSKLAIVEKQPDLQRGYFIPMWVNTGTYLRELHADFGIAGVFLGPYLIGLILTLLWFKFYSDGNLIALVLLVYFNIIVGFSFFVMFSRVGYWFFSLILLVIIIPILEKSAVFNRKITLES